MWWKYLEECVRPCQGPAVREELLPYFGKDEVAAVEDTFGGIEPDGWNFFHLAAGSFYRGEYIQKRKQEPHGVGRLDFISGAVYVGTFREGVIHGRGVYRSAEGVIHAGEIAFGEWEGVGIRCPGLDEPSEICMFERGKPVLQYMVRNPGYSAWYVRQPPPPSFRRYLELARGVAEKSDEFGRRVDGCEFALKNPTSSNWAPAARKMQMH